MAAREVTVFLLCILVVGISAESCRSATVCCTPDFHQCKGECSCIIFSYKSIQRRVLHVEFFAGTHRILYDSEEMTIIDNGIFHPRRVDNGQTPSSSSQFKTTQAATTSEQGGTSEWVTPSASPRPLSTGQTFTSEQGGTSESVITPSASPRPLSTGQTTTSEQSDTPYTVTPSASPLSTGQMLTSEQGGTSKLDTSSASPRPLSTEKMLTSEQGGTLKLVTPSASPRPLGTGQTTTSEQGDTPELVTPSASHSSTGQSYGTQTTHVFVNTSSLAYTKNSTEQNTNSTVIAFPLYINSTLATFTRPTQHGFLYLSFLSFLIIPVVAFPLFFLKRYKRISNKHKLTQSICLAHANVYRQTSITLLNDQNPIYRNENDPNESSTDTFSFHSSMSSNIYEEPISSQ
ncbi:uncharacterized protein LOC134276004 [Saccostrea cucullata]|uniref:uncharacterized protein LOC134276004 n=1 Tax=Saccostrea cuccullata TaxID=36930 RepID=UPI002ED2CCF5